jgi:hypothetical protein
LHGDAFAGEVVERGHVMAAARAERQMIEVEIRLAEEHLAPALLGDEHRHHVHAAVLHVIDGAVPVAHLDVGLQVRLRGDGAEQLDVEAGGIAFRIAPAEGRIVLVGDEVHGVRGARGFGGLHGRGRLARQVPGTDRHADADQEDDPQPRDPRPHRYLAHTAPPLPWVVLDQTRDRSVNSTREAPCEQG